MTHPVRLVMASSSVVAQRQIPIDQTVQKTVEIPQLNIIEKIVDTPVPQIVEELAETSKIFPQDRVQQSSADQTVEILAVSLAEKIVEMPVTQKTQLVVNTHVQHVVNAVEAEMLKITKETLQRKRPVINEKINQMTKHHEVPQSQVVEKTVEGQQLQIVGQFVETGQSTQTSEKLGTAPVCRSTQAEIVEAVEIEVPLPAESATPMSVTEPVLEVPQIVGKIDEIPEIRTDVGTQTSESSGTALVKDTEASVLKTPDSIKAHDQASLKTTRNPNGESYPAFASEKSWNEASGKTMAHRQVPNIETVQKIVEVPQTQHIDKVADVPVARPRQTLSVQRVQKTVEGRFACEHALCSGSRACSAYTCD